MFARIGLFGGVLGGAALLRVLHSCTASSLDSSQRGKAQLWVTMVLALLEHDGYATVGQAFSTRGSTRQSLHSRKGNFVQLYSKLLLSCYPNSLQFTVSHRLPAIPR